MRAEGGHGGRGEYAGHGGDGGEGGEGYAPTLCRGRVVLCRVVRMVRIAQHCVNTVHLAQLLEERYQVQKF